MHIIQGNQGRRMLVKMILIMRIIVHNFLHVLGDLYQPSMGVLQLVKIPTYQIKH